MSQINGIQKTGTGIVCIEFYSPRLFIEQNELEVHDQVSTGKYTIGLGQQQMAYCTDLEDVNSLSLTVVDRLMRRNSIAYKDIGRLDVGTETIIDKSKSVKTVLMQLFEENENFDVEGVDHLNACYGGTAALLDAINWCESSSWDGRYALVIAADNAIYGKGNARPTGGAGAVAMLIGRNAPIIVEPVWRSTCSKHAYDFYKPDMSSEYPVVDGKLTIECYLSALDYCYNKCKEKYQIVNPNQSFNLETFDAFIFHCPYAKLVQKSLARLYFNDFLNGNIKNIHPDLMSYKETSLKHTYFDKTLEKIVMNNSKDLFERKTLPTLKLSKTIGNMYTPSVYSGLVSYLLSKKFVGNERAFLFSYGSGFIATMYSIKIDENRLDSLEEIVKNLSHVTDDLDHRIKTTTETFEHILSHREKNHDLIPYKPVAPIDILRHNTWYLTDIDEKSRRKYERKSYRTTKELLAEAVKKLTFS
ncbi:hypothetical protein SNEBB_007899 [Seison nebaliae]|nr:hypothetical protein SNEBB_007899 [Seison nebaliae]